MTYFSKASPNIITSIPCRPIGLATIQVALCNTIVDLFCESAFFIAISHPGKRYPMRGPLHAKYINDGMFSEDFV